MEKCENCGSPECLAAIEEEFFTMAKQSDEPEECLPTPYEIKIELDQYATISIKINTLPF